MISYSVSYERWSPADYDHGEPGDRGWEDDAASDTFTDMIDILAYTHPSQDPVTDLDYLWFTDDGDANDHPARSVTQYLSYHPKSARDARYMLKAWMQSNA